MAQAAYALRADRDLDCVGTIVVDTSRAINVRALLETDGKTEDGVDTGPLGTYVTDDAAEITALDDYDPVKRTSLAEAAERQAAAKPAKASKADSKED